MAAYVFRNTSAAQSKACIEPWYFSPIRLRSTRNLATSRLGSAALKVSQSIVTVRP